MNELLPIVRLMMREKKDVVLSVIFGFLAGVTAVGLFAANGYLISQAALEPPMYVLIAMVAVVKIGSFIRALSRYAERYYSHRATFTMLSDMRVYFYEKVEKIGASLFQTYRSGDLLARIVGDVESLQNFFLRVLYPPIIMVLVFFSTIFFVSFSSIVIAACLLIGLFLTGVVIPAWFAKRQKKISSEIRQERAQLSTDVAEWFYGFRELKIHQQLEGKEQQLGDQSKVYVLEQKQEGLQSASNQALNVAVAHLISWSVLAIGAYFVTTGQLDGVLLAMLVMISFIVFEHSVPMAIFPIHYDESEQAAKRLEAVTAQDDKRESVPTQLSRSERAPSLSFRRASFRFGNEFRKTVENITIDFPSGSKTAIVGPSGSGKSTLMHLLLKWYEAEGELLVNDVPIEQIDQESIWAHANVVFQRSQFFYGTVRDNLLLSESEWSKEQLEQLLEDVQLSHFKLDDAVMEGGENLSGGEKQRLALARAGAKGGRLWLLDEPTSSIDLETEKKLYHWLLQQAKEDTFILISHRLSGLERMDQIVVMNEGKIIEVGTYAELLERKGFFYKLKEIESSLI
ncbi:thiol reductant ABC exporter subunit CydC [Halalkalibacter hemicellulosilyticus]|uniref:Transport ATP-binding protein CydC n=1 Tax=Halalkalibacter hemicellulosilyticusJCM 9152 TaxID=1236971 RepID=W4QCD2_9BACI|nr:thiol reductant ABC exporter subunit CydC [Halalkalibacter hemicellulosilyticus]GAE29612.1 transport ATP-binding protein CydC [Halalkalibacter hemicellulosilyticusJCM 9152]